MFQISILHLDDLLILNPTPKHLLVDASSTSQPLGGKGEYLGPLALLISPVMSSVCHGLVSVLGKGEGSSQMGGPVGMSLARVLETSRGGKHHWSVTLKRTYFMDCHLLLSLDHATSSYHWGPLQSQKSRCTS